MTNVSLRSLREFPSCWCNRRGHISIKLHSPLSWSFITLEEVLLVGILLRLTTLRSAGCIAGSKKFIKVLQTETASCSCSHPEINISASNWTCILLLLPWHPGSQSCNKCPVDQTIINWTPSVEQAYFVQEPIIWTKVNYKMCNNINQTFSWTSVEFNKTRYQTKWHEFLWSICACSAWLDKNLEPN